MNPLSYEFAFQFVNSFFWACVHSLWQGLLLVAIAYHSINVLKKQSAATRYNFLFALLLIFVFSFAYTFYSQFTTIESVQVAEVAIMQSQQDMLTGNDYALQDIEIGGLFVSSILAFINQHYFLFTVIWFFFFIFRIFKLYYRLKSIEHLLAQSKSGSGDLDNIVAKLAARAGVLKRITVRVSDNVISPAAVGLWRSIIIVPAGLLSSLPYEQLEAILLHELAHIKRNDYLHNFIQLFIEAIFYFNPGVILLSRLIRLERENCCDDIAVAISNTPNALASALVSCEEFSTTQLTLSLGFMGTTHPTLGTRIKRLLTKQDSKSLTTSPVKKSILLILPLVFSMLLIQSFQFRQGVSARGSHIVDTTVVSSGINFYETSIVGPGTAIKKQVDVKGVVIDVYIFENDGVIYQVEKQGNQIANILINGVAQSPSTVVTQKTEVSKLLELAFDKKPERVLWTEVKSNQEGSTGELTVPYNKNNQGMLTDGITARYFGNGYEIRIQDGRVREIYFEGKRVPNHKLNAYEVIVKEVVGKVDAKLKTLQ